MSGALDRLASRGVFGIKPGLESIRALCGRLGDPQRDFRAVHVAGTDGKGAVCAMLDACMRGAGLRTGRYTSPHLLHIAERFFIDGAPADIATLEGLAAETERAAAATGRDITFFEALTAMAFLLYSRAKPDFAIIETGLGGRLDATNICRSAACAITRVGLDHCALLGGTVEEIAAEKAGIIKPGVPVVLGANGASVVETVRAAAERAGAPFVYAPQIADESEIPEGFPLGGGFNRENAVTAIAVLKTLGLGSRETISGMRDTVWPGRFQRAGRFLVDGAHNPPAARALADSLGGGRRELVAGFCADKDVDAVLALLAPHVSRAYAVPIRNPRSLDPETLAAKMRAAGMEAEARGSLREALDASAGETLVCGSLFLAGEALGELGAYPWPLPGTDNGEMKT